MRISSIYHYFFGLPNKDLEIIEKVKTQRHLLHKQINLSKIKLKPTITVIRTGIYFLDKKNINPANIPIPINKIKFVDEFEKKKKRIIKKHKYR
jgi:hypothetical protein